VYRIRELFSYLEYNMNVTMLAVTLVRNFSVRGAGAGAPAAACCCLCAAGAGGS
jgi:hypothetical protein